MRSICTKPYGRALAEKVATYLLSGKNIAYQHRDYCGMGLAYDPAKKKFAYGLVQDDGGALHAHKSWDNK